MDLYLNDLLAARATELDQQDECDDPDCACHGEDVDEDGDADFTTVTMAEVYDDPQDTGRGARIGPPTAW